MQSRQDLINSLLERALLGKKKILNKFQQEHAKMAQEKNVIARAILYTNHLAHIDFVSEKILDKELKYWKILCHEEPNNKLIQLNYLLANAKKTGNPIDATQLEWIFTESYEYENKNVNSLYAKAIASRIIGKRNKSTKYFTQCLEASTKQNVIVDNDELTTFNKIFSFTKEKELICNIKDKENLLTDLQFTLLVTEAENIIKNKSTYEWILQSVLDGCNYLLENHLNVSKILALQGQLAETRDQIDDALLYYSLSDYFDSYPIIPKELLEEHSLSLPAEEPSNQAEIYNDFLQFDEQHFSGLKQQYLQRLTEKYPEVEFDKMTENISAEVKDVLYSYLAIHANDEMPLQQHYLSLIKSNKKCAITHYYLFNLIYSNHESLKYANLIDKQLAMVTALDHLHAAASLELPEANQQIQQLYSTYLLEIPHQNPLFTRNSSPKPSEFI